MPRDDDSAIRYLFSRPVLPRSLTIALVVGVVLCAVNQGDVLVNGDLCARVWIKVLFNFLVRKFRANKDANPVERAKELARENIFLCPKGCDGQLALTGTRPYPRAPSPDEIEACIPYLYEDFERYKPEIIISMGAPATNAIRGKVAQITKIRGRIYLLPHNGVPLRVIPTIHTSFVQRGKYQYRSYIAADLSEAKRFAHKRPVHTVEYKIINDTEGAIAHLNFLLDAYKDGAFKAVAFDIMP